MRPRPRREAYQDALTAAGRGGITTEVREAPDYYYAEEYHQQYLAKNPGGYCGLGGTGVACSGGGLTLARRPDRRARPLSLLASFRAAAGYGSSRIGGRWPAKGVQ